MPLSSFTGDEEILSVFFFTGDVLRLMNSLAS